MVINWTHIYKRYKGLWVALKDDEVSIIASGKTVKDVMEESKKEGFNASLLFRVPARIIP